MRTIFVLTIPALAALVPAQNWRVVAPDPMPRASAGMVFAARSRSPVEQAGQYSHGMRIRAALTGRAHDGRLRGLVLWA